MSKKQSSKNIEQKKFPTIQEEFNSELVNSLEEIVEDLLAEQANSNRGNSVVLNPEQANSNRGNSVVLNAEGETYFQGSNGSKVFNGHPRDIIRTAAQEKNSFVGNGQELPFGQRVKDLLFEERQGNDTPLDNGDANSALFPDYELVFSDEFNGEQLDLTKWNTNYYYGSRTNTFNNEEQYYVDDAFEFNDGILSIVGKQESIEAFESVDQYLLGEQGKDLNFDYTSGMLSGHDRVAFTYGYMEIRAQVPQGQGLWPAFWMLPSSGEWPPEIDIMEILGDQTDVAYQTVHYQDDAGGHNLTGGYYAGGVDFSQDFHTFGADWNAEGITWYLDGVEIFTVEENIPTESMYLLANMAIGGDWPGAPDETTPELSSYDIDYIRVYQNSDSILHGGLGDDVLSRENGHLAGEDGDDILVVAGTGSLDGGDGHDTLTGGSGDNVLDGGDGHDLLRDGQGVDVFTGGAGADNFILGDANSFYTSRRAEDYAIITDFDSAEDRIHLSGVAGDYNLGAAVNELDGVGIYLKHDLVAVVQSTTELNLRDNSFIYSADG